MAASSPVPLHCCYPIVFIAADAATCARFDKLSHGTVLVHTFPDGSNGSVVFHDGFSFVEQNGNTGAALRHVIPSLLFSTDEYVTV